MGFLIKKFFLLSALLCKQNSKKDRALASAAFGHTESRN